MFRLKIRMWQTFKVALFLAYKSISRGNRGTIVLMIFILSLAFINLIFISGILNGIIATIDRQIKTNLVSNLVIEPQEEPVKKDFIVNAQELKEEIERMPGVAKAATRYGLSGSVSYDKEKNGKFKFSSAEILGINPEEENSMSGVREGIIAGRYLEGLGNGDILLGADLAGGYSEFVEAQTLGGPKVGDKVKVAFSNGLERDYTVRGIFRVDFGFADRRAIITQKEAESVLSVYDNASQILVKVQNEAEEDRLQGEIQKIAPNLRVKKWTEYRGALGGISRSFDMITLIISAIGLAVAAITIFILIYVNVVHKRRQIGILKAIGINQSIVIYSYIFQALFYATSGIVIGTLLTFFFLVPYFLKHPMQFSLGDTSLALSGKTVVSAIAGLLAAALVAGFVPSWRGAKENILKAIWGT